MLGAARNGSIHKLYFSTHLVIQRAQRQPDSAATSSTVLYVCTQPRLYLGLRYSEVRRLADASKVASYAHDCTEL